MGADALGFICVASSPRYVTVSEIAPITTNLISNYSKLDLIGVFLNASAEEIYQTIEQGKLNGVQLHGNESPEFCREVRSHLDQINPKIKLIKAIRVKDSSGLEQAKLFSAVVDVVLLDAYDPQMAGGTGKTLDWQMLRDFRLHCDWWLAGGLSPANVEQAIALVCPSGLDVSSGVERSTGDKDLSKVREFLAYSQPKCS